MLNLDQQRRLKAFKEFADKVEKEANKKLLRQAVKMLQAGFPERMVAKQCFLPIKLVEELNQAIA